MCPHCVRFGYPLRVLKAIDDAVPVRLMKRDLPFLAERLTAMLDELRLSVVPLQYGIGKFKGDMAFLYGRPSAHRCEMPAYRGRHHPTGSLG